MKFFQSRFRGRLLEYLMIGVNSARGIGALLVSLFVLNVVSADQELNENELVGDAVGGSIVAEFNGFVRTGSGMLETIPIAIRNVSDSIAYELLLDHRLPQVVIQVLDGETPLNNPLARERQLRMMGDIPLNLVRLGPGEVHEVDVVISEHVESSVYEDLQEIGIRFILTVPIYEEGASTVSDSRIEIMNVNLFRRPVPVVDNQSDPE